MSDPFIDILEAVQPLIDVSLGPNKAISTSTLQGAGANSGASVLE